MSDLTGPPPPPEPDPTTGPVGRDPDEIASALLDGQLSPEEAARAQADPEVVTRLTALQQVRTQLRDVPPPPPGHADRAVAGALAALDLDQAAPPSPLQSPPPLHSVPTASGPRPPSPVTPFPPPAARGGHPQRWLAAAAAIVVVALVAVGLLSRDSDSSDDNTAAAQASDETTSGGEEEGGEGGGSTELDDRGDSAEDDAGATSGGSDTEAPSASTDVEVLDLGELSPSNLLAFIPDAIGSGEFTPPDPPIADQTERDNPSCPGLSVAGDPGRGEMVFVADATFDGTPVRVHAYEDPADGLLQVVVTDHSCNSVLDQPTTG